MSSNGWVTGATGPGDPAGPESSPPGGVSVAELVERLGSAAAALAAAEVPSSGRAAMAEAEALLRADDLVNVAIDARVGVVDLAKTAKHAGYSSTKTWLREAGGQPGSKADQRRRNGRQWRRLATTFTLAAEGKLGYAVASAIANAVSVLKKDQDALVAEQILVKLADDAQTTPEKIAQAGSHLRAVLNPDGHQNEADRVHGKRYMSANVEDDGGVSGRYYLPPGSAARLKALFDKYALPAGDNDDRTAAQRRADVLMQLLINAVTTEMLVIVNAETLPDDPTTGHPAAGGDDTGSTPTDTNTGDDGDSDGPGGPGSSGGRGGGGIGGSGGGGRAWPWPEHGLGDIDGRSADVDDADDLDVAAGAQVLGERCPECGRHTNRDVPGLLLATGHPLPAKHIHRLARTSRLYRMVLAAPSFVLDLGRAVRFVPGWMRRAVLARYDTCSYGTCPIPAQWCEMDHVFDWAHHGETKVEDIAPGCDPHNRDRADHPEKYQRERLPDGRWHFKILNKWRL